MIATLPQKENKLLYYRLIALWILVESVLGGILHGFKIPVTGLLVGGSAMICIIFIGRYFPAKGSILKAMLVVASFKLMLSPHSPVAAYIAVFFQGLMGELLLRNRWRLVSSMGFGLITMLESAIQRILVLVILYGSHFWEAVDVWLVKTLKQPGLTNFSLMAATTYLTIHVLAGLGLGYLGWKLSSNKSTYPKPEWQIPAFDPDTKSSMPSESSQKKHWLKAYRFLGLGLLFLLLQVILIPDSAILPRGHVLELIYRFALIITIWKLILEPILHYALRRYLESRKGPLQSMVNDIRLVLPSMQWMAVQSWKKAEGNLTKPFRFLQILFYNITLNESR